MLRLTREFEEIIERYGATYLNKYGIKRSA